jgi:TRAP-type uncharacterized transport system fused permease subunit
MQTSQHRTFQIILTIVGIIALASLYILRFQDIQLAENQDSIIRFIAFGCLAGANYLNYKKSMGEGKTNSKALLWLSIFLGIIALTSLSRIFF